MKLTSPAFEHKGEIPSKFTCDGKNINPPLVISDVPKGTQSLVIIFYDPDIPQKIKEELNISSFDHWVLFNINPNTKEIAENSAPGVQGNHSRGEVGYGPPCPPPQFQPTTHRYIFILYALDTMLDLKEGSSKKAVESAMEGHIIDKTGLIGKYDRSR